MKLLELANQILTERKSLPDFGCIMLYLDFPYLKDIHSKIDKDDIDESEGLETDPHVTLLCGIKSDETSLEEITKLIEKFKFSSIVVNKASLFEKEQYDVLKFKASGPNLLKINNILAKSLPNDQMYPTYQPHVTIGYIQSGEGKKYTKLFKDNEFELDPTHVVYSTPTGEKHKIKIIVDRQ